MTYAALTNWKYDKNLYHTIQSGPQRTSDDLNLTDKYILTSSGYVYASGQQQTFVALTETGADFGNVILAPYPQNTEWKAVPTVVSGYWNNYDDSPQRASGLLTVYNGYRRQAMISTANATVQTAFGPIPGVKSIGAFTYWNGAVPSNQFYDPFNTPYGQDDAKGITGGAGTYPRGGYPMLYSTVTSGTGSRTEWEYAPPVYCQTFAAAERSNVPGSMDAVIRSMYRGRASTYVPNYGGTYGVLGEGVRNMVRTFSPSVNSSNQKSI